MSEDHLFIDYYDVLQVSPNADQEIIRSVFRHLAKKCHPDLPNGGNAERFRQILKAHNVLTNPKKRAAYDVKYQEYWDRKWQLVREAGDGRFSNNRELRERILTLLYVQRRSDMRHPGLGDMELARLLRVSPEFLDFDLWYLRTKRFIERLDTGLLAISVEGVDHLEQNGLRPVEDHLLEAHNPA